MATVEDVTAQIKRLIAEHKYQDAVRLARRALLSKPESVPLRLLLGVALLALRRYDEVRAEMTIVLRHSPKEPTAYRLLGEAYLHAGQPGRAKEPLKQAISLAPGDRDAQRLLDNATILEGGNEEETLDRWFDTDAIATVQRHVDRPEEDLAGGSTRKESPAYGGSNRPRRPSQDAVNLKKTFPEPLPRGGKTLPERPASKGISERPLPTRTVPSAPPTFSDTLPHGTPAAEKPRSVPPPLPPQAVGGSVPSPSKPPPSNPPPRQSSAPAPPPLRGGRNVFAGRTVLGLASPKLPSGLTPSGSSDRPGIPPRVSRPELPPVGLLTQPGFGPDEENPTLIADRDRLMSDYPSVEVAELGPMSSFPPELRGGGEVPVDRSDPSESVNPLWKMGRSPSDRPPQPAIRPRAPGAFLGAKWRNHALLGAGFLGAALVVGLLVLFFQSVAGPGEDLERAVVTALADGRREAFAAVFKSVSEEAPGQEALPFAHLRGAALLEYGLGSDAELAALIDGAGTEGAREPSVRGGAGYLWLSRLEAPRALETVGQPGPKDPVNLWYVRAIAAEEAGSVAAALEAARHVSKEAPTSARYVAARAWLEAANGDPKVALALLDGLKDGDQFPAVRMARARILRRQGDASGRAVEEAKVVLGKLSHSASSNDVAWARVILAADALTRGDRTTASTELGAAAALRPRPWSTVLWFEVMTLMLEAGDSAKVKAELATFPKPLLQSAPAILVQARAALLANAVDNAKVLLDTAPDVAEVWLARGEVSERLGQPLAAEAAYQRAMTDARLRNRAAQAFSRVAMARGAPGLVVEALGAMPNATEDETLVAVLATAYVALNRKVDAQRLLGDALKAHGDSIPLKVAHAELRLAMGEAQAALEDARTLLAARPSDPDALRLLGRAALAAGDPSAAEKAFTALHAANPGDAAARLGLARLAVDRMAFADAAKFLAGLETSTDPDVRRLVGEVALAKGEGLKAAKVLEPLAKGAGGEALLLLYGQALVQAEAYGAAQKALSKVLAKDPKNPEAHLALANVTLRAGSLGPVGRMLDTAEREGVARKRGRFFEARVLTARGRLAYELGALAQAQTWAKQAVDKAPNAGEAHHLLADIAMERGGRPVPHLEDAEKGAYTPPEAIAQLALRVTEKRRACVLATRYLDAAPDGFDAPRVENHRPHVQADGRRHEVTAHPRAARRAR